MLSCWFLAQIILSTLKMEAIFSSETSVDSQWTTWRYIPDGGTLHSHHCENLKSYNIKCLIISKHIHTYNVNSPLSGS
jgi:hypothetical protein